MRFQSTHPRRVRPTSTARLLTTLYVSIHAPTQGATWCYRQPPHRQQVSIHAPTQGATNRNLKSSNRICFNPRTHAGCDVRIIRLARSLKSFNPRTHAGCDSSARRQTHLFSVSIHAPTQGATSVQTICSLYFQRFNPRTHAGCDLYPGHTVG